MAGMALLLGAGAAHADPSLEYPVKATYLYKFAGYVTWPADAFASPTAPLVLCIVGADPFGSTLDKAVARQHFDGHPIQVLRLQGTAADAPCHIAYIGAPNSEGVNKTIQGLRQRGILTVSDAPGSEASINFVIAENRVRFEIDQAAAAEAGLGISSRLLNLAVTVKPRPPKPPSSRNQVPNATDTDNVSMVVPARPSIHFQADGLANRRDRRVAP